MRALTSKQGHQTVAAIGKRYRCKIDLRSLQGATSTPQSPLPAMNPPIPPGRPVPIAMGMPVQPYPMQYPGRPIQPPMQYPMQPPMQYPTQPPMQYPTQPYPGRPMLQQQQAPTFVDLAITSPSKKVAALVRRDLEQWLRVQAPHVIVTDFVDCEHHALHNLYDMARKLPSIVSRVVSQCLGIHDVTITVRDTNRGKQVSSQPHSPHSPRPPKGKSPRKPKSPKKKAHNPRSPKPQPPTTRTLQLRGPCMSVAALKQRMTPDASGNLESILVNLLASAECVVKPFTAAQEKRARVVVGIFNRTQTNNQFDNDDDSISAFLAFRADVIVINVKGGKNAAKLVVKLCGYDRMKLGQARAELHAIIGRITQQTLDLTSKQFYGKYIRGGACQHLLTPSVVPPNDMP